MGVGQSKDVEASQPSKIERRMVKAMAERAQSGQFSLKSFNSIIMKFHKIDESFEAVRIVFRKYDKDGSGAIDMEELKHCLKELKVEISEKEVEELHAESDMDSSHAIEFKEFIVLLALVYLLGVSSSSGSTSEPGQPTQKSRIGLPQLEATFDTIVEAFVFFDRNKDGYVSKEDLVDAINRSSPGRQGDKIGLERFEEMDWDKNGTVTFKEFLFAFTDWVGLEDEGDDDFVSPS